MGPPVIAAGAPVAAPQTPNVAHNAPIMPPGQVAARIDYNTLRGHVPRPGATCKGCDENGAPSLRDVAPPSWISRMPRWMLWVGGLAGLGLGAWFIFRLVRR